VGTVPGTPQSLMKVSADVGQITFSWQPPSDDGGTPITDYIVYWDRGQGAAMTLLKESVGGPLTEFSTQGTITALDLIDALLYKF